MNYTETIRNQIKGVGYIKTFCIAMVYFLNYLYWSLFLKRFGLGSYIAPGVKILNKKRVSIGRMFRVYHNSFFCVGRTGRIIIGNNGHIGVGSYLNATKARIIIGNNVSIAPKTQIYSYSNLSIKNNKLVGEHDFKDVIIGDNVWVGAGAIILSGVRVGNGSVIGAGAVVRDNVPEKTVVVGVPARVIKKLK